MSDIASNDKKETNDRTFSRIAFAFGEVGDNTAYQTFSFLIFIFYFTVVKLDVLWITMCFIIWSLYNSFNDPIIGYLSDRTRTKWGRRTPWMIAAIIPLAIIMVLLFFPPINSGDLANSIYLLVILFLFDTVYSAFNLNYNSIFSEMFVSVKDRSEMGKIRGIFVIVSLIIAFILPTIIIEDITNQRGLPDTLSQYQLTGIIAAIVIVVFLSLTMKFGIQEPKIFAKDAETAFSLKNSVSSTLKNKAFLIFLLPALSTWICIGILPTIIPLFATFVLKVTEEDSLLTGVILLSAFLTAGISMPLWEKIRKSKGARITGLIGIMIWAITLFIFMFTTEIVSAIIVMIFAGVGLGGSLYFYDQCLAEIIDEDEIEHGTRRAGSYYGIINFLIRLSAVINFTIIGLIFSGAEWSTYTPNPGVDAILGIQFLIGIFPLIVLLIGFIGLYFYPIKGARLEENRKKLTTLHEEKQKKV